MTKMTCDLPPVKPTSNDWPLWTDCDRFELGPHPSDDDAAWWACHAPGNCADYDVEGLDEHAAAEMAAQDSLERGLIPNDVAEYLSRSSLVGLADEILHAGSDPAQCRCFYCVERRTRIYAE